MRKVAVFAVVGVVALVAPAAGKQPKPPKPSKPHPCVVHKVGYNASGTLVSAALTAAGNGRYNGTLEVNVTKANHRAPTGNQTFTLAAARVKFHHGVNAAAPAAGSRVKLHGKITHLPKRCPTTGFTPTITIKKVDLKRAKS
jgi:hypothetical protein